MFLPLNGMAFTVEQRLPHTGDLESIHAGLMVKAASVIAPHHLSIPQFALRMNDTPRQFITPFIQ